MKLFLFVHGYGSSPKDFSSLPEELKRRGLFTENFVLPGHEDWSHDYLCPDTALYLQLLLEKILALKNDGYEVYLVGFSFGATLSLAVEKLTGVSGMVLFGAFLGAPWHKRLVASMLNSISPEIKLARSVNVTRKETLKKLKYASDFPIRGAKKVIEFADEVYSSTFEPRCRVIFFHSVSDRISNYELAGKFASKAQENVDFIPFHGLNHFLVHDISLSDIADVLTEFFGLSIENGVVDYPYVNSLYVQLNEEHRFWALRIFQLVLAFFAVFGLYLTNTLGVVLKAEPGAVYYLLSYATIILIYAILAAMYYFFMVRTQVFLTYILEPFFPIQGFQQYKLSNLAAGSASRRVSSYTSLAIMNIPMFAAAYSMMQVLFQYRERFVLTVDNAFAISWLVVNLLLFYWALRTGSILIDYGKKKLYCTPTPKRRSVALSIAISKLMSNLN